MSELRALIFDCDGVLAETERDGHRVTFNAAFEAAGLPTHWDDATYGELVLISGGKERMRHYFTQHPEQLPAGTDLDELVVALHKDKTRRFGELSASGGLPVRAGINRLIDQAHENGVKLCICTTSNEKSVRALMNAILGEERTSWFDEVLAGDIVPRKKPAPDIYLLAQERLQVKPEECFVVEDSHNGLVAASEAGLSCLITVSHYSAEEDFTGADLTISSLGDPGQPAIDFLQYNPAVPASTQFINLKHLQAILAAKFPEA